jgi:hypothetical protein
MVSVGWGRLKSERIKICECAFSDLADEMTCWRARVFSCRVALSKPQMGLFRAIRSDSWLRISELAKQMTLSRACVLIWQICNV